MEGIGRRWRSSSGIFPFEEMVFALSIAFEDDLGEWQKGERGRRAKERSGGERETDGSAR